MSLESNDLLLYAVTDSAWTQKQSLESQVQAAIDGGITFLQLREKNIDDDAFIDLALKIKKLTDKANIPFVINDNINVALAVNADGVHIGQDDMTLKEARALLGNDKIIGVSVHNLKEAELALKDGADYLGIGAVFNTSTKLDAKALSLDTIREVSHTIDLPIVAIGGINHENILQLKNSGINGVAVVSSIFAQENIKQATEKLLSLVKEII